MACWYRGGGCKLETRDSVDKSNERRENCNLTFQGIQALMKKERHNQREGGDTIAGPGKDLH